MEVDSELTTWLKAQHEAGRTESSGHFTLESAKAWERLAAHSLPFEHAWTLKLVQSAVSAEVALRIRQSRRETSFEWSAWSYSPEELSNAVFRPLEGGIDPALAHLGSGVRALAKMTRLPFSIAYPDGTVAIWTGGDFQVSQAKRSDDGALRLTVSHFLRNEASWLLSADNFVARRRSIAITRAIAQHCHWAPEDVTLDGRPVGNVLNDSTFGPSQRCQPLLFLRSPPAEGHPSLCAPVRYVQASLPNEAPKVVLDRDPVETLDDLTKPSLAIVLVGVFIDKVGKGRGYEYKPGKQASYLAWISDGVEVARERLPLEPGPVAALIACSATDLATDLTGLTPRQGEAWAKRRRAALDGAQALLASSAGSVHPVVTTTSRSFYLGAAILGGVLAFVAPPTLILTIGFGASYLSTKQLDAAVQVGIETGIGKLAADLLQAD